MHDKDLIDQAMRQAIHLSLHKMQEGQGGPFGAVIMKGNKQVAEGWNQVTSTNDPTAHAEVVAIRSACKTLETFDLSGCTLFTSCEPCPMCLAAIMWARIDCVYYGNTRYDAASIGFDDEFFYLELEKEPHDRRIPLIPTHRSAAQVAFQEWLQKQNRILY